MPGPAIAKQGTCSQYILYSVSVYSIHGWAVFFLKNQSFCVIDTLMGCLFVFLLILKSTYCLLTVYSGCTDDVLTFNFFFCPPGARYPLSLTAGNLRSKDGTVYTMPNSRGVGVQRQRKELRAQVKFSKKKIDSI